MDGTGKTGPFNLLLVELPDGQNCATIGHQRWPPGAGLRMTSNRTDLT